MHSNLNRAQAAFVVNTQLKGKGALLRRQGALPSSIDGRLMNDYEEWNHMGQIVRDCLFQNTEPICNYVFHKKLPMFCDNYA